MCNDVMIITIEEWDGDNNTNLTDEQVKDLMYAINIAYDMRLPCGYGV